MPKLDRFSQTLMIFVASIMVSLLLPWIVAIPRQGSLNLLEQNIIVRNPNPFLWQPNHISADPTVLVYSRVSVWGEMRRRLDITLRRDQYITVTPLQCQDPSSTYGQTLHTCTHTSLFNENYKAQLSPNLLIGDFIPTDEQPELESVTHPHCDVRSAAFDGVVLPEGAPWGGPVRMVIYTMDCEGQWLIVRGFNTIPDNISNVERDTQRFVHRIELDNRS